MKRFRFTDAEWAMLEQEPSLRGLALDRESSYLALCDGDDTLTTHWVVTHALEEWPGFDWRVFRVDIGKVHGL